jgi:hypothetical protein
LAVLSFLQFGPANTTVEVANAQADGPAEVGVAPVGRTALEFTGRIDQEGNILRLHGYVTHLYDLPAGLLFSQPITHSEATARITMSGTATLTERTAISNVFHVDAVGIVNFYFDEDEGASFDDLNSFGRGEMIGSTAARLQNVLTVVAPDFGITNGSGEMIHAEAVTFVLDGEEYTFGREGMVQRVAFTGSGVRFVPNPPVAMIAIGGATTVAGFDMFVPLAAK